MCKGRSHARATFVFFMVFRKKRTFYFVGFKKSRTFAVLLRKGAIYKRLKD